jgi:hypothetical protein
VPLQTVCTSNSSLSLRALPVCDGLKRPTGLSLCGHSKKRYPHAHRIVSFMYNPGAKRRGQLLSSYNKLIKNDINYSNYTIIMGNARRIWINFLLYSDQIDVLSPLPLQG